MEYDSGAAPARSRLALIVRRFVPSAANPVESERPRRERRSAAWAERAEKGLRSDGILPRVRANSESLKK